MDIDGLALQQILNLQAGATQKLEEIFKYAMTAKDQNGKLILVGNIVNELQVLVEPSSLAIAGAIFVGFSMLQVTPFGWLADTAMTELLTYYLEYSGMGYA